MTEFKVGDRLRGTATGRGALNGNPDEATGVFTGEYSGLNDDWPKVVSGGDEWSLDPDFPIEVVNETPKLAFVGPEPTVTLPFEVDQHAVITDSRDNYVGEVCGVGLSTEQDQELAELIRDLLNEHFGVEGA